MIFKGEEIFQLIPQRPPIVMVDVVWSATETDAVTGLTVASDNIFVENGMLREPGVIEHIAQSAAAFAGYGTFVRGENPKLGYIGEIKDFRLLSSPEVGSQLRTEILLVAEAVGVSLISAQTTVDDLLIAKCQMKIFIKED